MPAWFIEIVGVDESGAAFFATEMPLTLHARSGLHYRQRGVWQLPSALAKLQLASGTV
jgi:hypothetical protein